MKIDYICPICNNPVESVYDGGEGVTMGLESPIDGRGLRPPSDGQDQIHSSCMDSAPEYAFFPFLV